MAPPGVCGVASDRGMVLRCPLVSRLAHAARLGQARVRGPDVHVCVLWRRSAGPGGGEGVLRAAARPVACHVRVPRDRALQRADRSVEGGRDAGRRRQGRSAEGASQEGGSGRPVAPLAGQGQRDAGHVERGRREACGRSDRSLVEQGRRDRSARLRGRDRLA